MKRIGMTCVLLLAAFGIAGTSVASPDFAREVRPILERSCFGCHGPEKQKNGYRLDVRDIAIKGGDSGERAIVPHDAKSSPLIRYVSGEDEDMLMPPKKSDKARLTAAEVETLRAWIDAGPAWPDEFAGPKEAKPHWSLQPLVKPAVPRNDANPIDAFIHAKLAEKKLAPSPEADARTLIRRVYFDLTGLPPTPGEVEAFVQSTVGNSQLAMVSLVDRLLASPRYGERWARHWLDTIHFADSHGFEHDVGRDNAWRFRDYVIAALNKDTPWPRFIREQLAADVFFPNEPRLMPALGYLGAGTFDLSAFGTAPVTFDYLDRDDLVTQTMAAFVSTTANCARCHAHKFDPISQEDYYALQAVFAGVLKGDVSYDEDAAVQKPRRRWQSLLAAADKRDATVLLASENAPLVDAMLAQRRAAKWQPLAADTFISAEGATLTRGQDGVIVASGTLPERDSYTITAATLPERMTALRLNVLPHDSLPMRGPGRAANGNLHLSEIELRVFEPGAAEGRVVKLAGATADFNQEGWGIERAVDGDMKTAWGIHPAEGQAHHAVVALAEPLTLKPGARLAIVLRQAHGSSHLIGAFSLAVTTDAAANAAALPEEVEAAMAAAERTETQRIALAAHALRIVAKEALAKLPPQSVVYAAASSVNIPAGEGAMQARSLPEPKVVNILHRGDFDKPRAIAEPGALSALTHLPARFVLKNPKDEAERRAALADWIAHPNNVLTWRSIVNRVWHHHFGRGLCDTPSDFGKMGGEPSHVELLDWLAIWFRDDAHGSLKELHRLIVTSATYRQASGVEGRGAKGEGQSVDAGNVLLWRQNPHRLDADAFRDFTLAVSGKLDLTMGGPSIRHFKASKGPQATPSLDYTAYDWNSPGAGRRSIYRNVWRGIADPFMEALDFPDLGLLAPVRSFSVSSLQALTLFNNDFVLHHSAALAARTEVETTTLEAQVANAVSLVWLREPTANEQRDFIEFARANGLAALCRVLLNSNEFLFIP